MQPTRSTRASGSRTIAEPKKTSSSQNSARLTSDLLPSGSGRDPPVIETARAKVRREIAETTTINRNAFLLAKQDYFTPLLPSGNYIEKLQRKAGSQSAPPEIVPYTDLESQPQNVQAVMKPYQLKGLSFLLYMHRNGMSAILGDEMGLGKTLQTLSLFQYLKDNEPVTGQNQPFLVVCPLSVLSSWLNEAQKWVPNLNVVRFHGPKAERDALKIELGTKARSEKKIDIVVTTYDAFVADERWFKQGYQWRYIVLDEGHKLKNDKSHVATALQGLNSAHRLLLTGTPLQNNLGELWSLLHWLYPDVFGAMTADNFKRAFDLTKGKVSTGFMDNARFLLELIMLRRMKSSPGVNLDLPPKEDVLLYIPLTPIQRFWYKRLLTKVDSGLLEDVFMDSVTKEVIDEDKKTALDQLSKTFKSESDAWAESREIVEQAVRNETIDKSGTQWRKLMNLLVQLRKVCSHPYLLPNAAPEPYFYGEHIKTASSKFIVLDKLIDELVLKQKKKILIFSQYNMTLDMIEDLLVLKGCTNTAGPAPFRYNRFDGSTGRSRRNLGIRMFNDPQSDTMIMLISTRAGGLGINLTAATSVVFMDEDWNPQVTLQAEARAHRIGQTQTVTVYKLCTQGTVEEQMMGRIYKKLYLSTKITESMRNIHHESDSKKRKHDELEIDVNQEDGPHLDTGSLMSLVRRGAQTLVKPEIDVTEMLSWDWEKIIEQCKDHPIDVKIKLEGTTDSELERNWLGSMERVETAVFEGKKHAKKVEKKEDFDDPIDRADRRVNKNTTVMVDGYAISKESMNCGQWEAVPTMAGKDPRLADPIKVKKAAIVHQEHCQVCWGQDDHVNFTKCKGCPRAYHPECFTATFQGKSAAFGGSRTCPQHNCAECMSNTSAAGGMIYRCRWCERGFCEDCLDWDTVRLLGGTLAELEMLGFGEVTQAFYIECPMCIERFDQSPEDARFMEAEKARIAAEYERFIDESPSLEPGASTAGGNSTGVSTPATYSEAPTPRYGGAPVAIPLPGPAPTAKQAQIQDWATDKDGNIIPINRNPW